MQALGFLHSYRDDPEELAGGWETPGGQQSASTAWQG